MYLLKPKAEGLVGPQAMVYVQQMVSAQQPTSL